MSASVYILHSLLWSTGGFAWGWIVCALARDVREIEEHVMPQRIPWRARISAPSVVGAVLVVLAVLTMLGSLVAIDRLQATARCQSTFNDAYRAALIERSESTAQVRARQAALGDALRANTLADPQVRQALDEYVRALGEDEARRQANPVPVNRCPN